MTHEADAPELVADPASQFAMAQEARVLAAARALFPGGVPIGLPHDGVPERLKATERALARGDSAIFEATFSEDGVVVVVDILAHEKGSNTLIEVSSSTSIQDHDLMDAALKALVLRRVGVEVDAVEIMHLNDACRYPDLDDLFVREAVSGRVRALFPEISALISDQAKRLRAPLPEVQVGRHCDKPRPCPFRSRCWPVLPRHHVETFFGLRQEMSAQLEAQGLEAVEDVPGSFPLTLIQRRQQRSVTQGELQVEGDLAGALAPLKGRVAYLDFETLGLAIPVWEGLGPWHPHPVQFSCHIASPDQDLEHVAWLGEGPGDSRSAMARALVDALDGVETVVTYNLGSDRKCFELIASGAPDQARALNAIKSKLRDLLPLVRNHVYHPDFLGSFDLDSVLPALIPDLEDGSRGDSNGQTPASTLHRLLFLGYPKESAERDTLRQGLLDHCAMKTLALLRLKERLDGLAEGDVQG